MIKEKVAEFQRLFCWWRWEETFIFFTKDELDTLFNLEIPKNGTVLELKDMDGKDYKKTVMESVVLGKARDLFCFCAFTSLRCGGPLH